MHVALLEPNHRIADELAGAVVRDVAAAPRPAKEHSAAGALALVPQDVRLVRPSPEGDDMGMLEEEERVEDPILSARGDPFLLKANGVVVSDASQEPDFAPAGYSSASSKFSSDFLRTFMN